MSAIGGKADITIRRRVEIIWFDAKQALVIMTAVVLSLFLQNGGSVPNSTTG